MAIELIPGILTDDVAIAQQQLMALRGVASTVQIDFADGIFTPRKSLTADAFPQSVLAGFKIEVHLMTKNPDAYVAEWISKGARRIIVHVESQPSAQLIQSIVHDGCEVVIAIMPKTPVTALDPYLHIVSAFLFLHIFPPGLQKQPMDMQSVARMSEFHKSYPAYILESDGGVSDQTLTRVLDAGSTRVVIGSTMFTPSRTPAEHFTYYSQLIAAYSQGKES